MSFHAKLTSLHKSDPRFVDDEGELVLAAIQDRAEKKLNKAFYGGYQ